MTALSEAMAPRPTHFIVFPRSGLTVTASMICINQHAVGIAETRTGVIGDSSLVGSGSSGFSCTSCFFDCAFFGAILTLLTVGQDKVGTIYECDCTLALGVAGDFSQVEKERKSLPRISKGSSNSEQL